MFNSPFITNDGMASCEVWIGYDLWVIMTLFSPVEKEKSGLFCYKIHDTEYFMLWSDMIYIMFVWMRLWDPLCFSIGVFKPNATIILAKSVIIETLTTAPFIFQGINLCCACDKWPSLLSIRCSLKLKCARVHCEVNLNLCFSESCWEGRLWRWEVRAARVSEKSCSII